MSERLDVLNRDVFVENLVQLVNCLSDKEQGCCFGLDGAWGSGKSFVLDKFEEKLKCIQSEKTKTDTYFVFHYDCWKYDYYDEPAIAIIAAMLDATDKELSLFSEGVENAKRLGLETVRKTLKTIAGELCKNKIGIDLVDLASNILEEHDKEREQDFDELYGFKRALEATRKGIQDIGLEKTVVIVVDELDRCLPTYSIKVLERLHHIFDGLNNVIVIVSMDKRQLAHSIKEIYGNIDVDTYLRKFIAFKVCLDTGKAKGYADKFASYFSMFEDGCNDEVESFFIDIMSGMDMRTQERIFRKAEIIHRIISSNEKMDSSIMTFEILFLTLAFKLKSTQLQWLLDTSHYVEIEGKLTKNYYNMLRQYGKQVGATGHKYGGAMVIKDNVIGKTFYWIANALNSYDQGICGPYYYNKNVGNEIIIIKKFCKLIEIIDED